MTVSDVRGTGNSEETSRFGTGTSAVALPIRSRIEVVVPAEQVPEVIDAILETARTGEPGDGKIFVEPILDAIRIRTGETGSVAA